jgi:hypothetical protein
MRRTEAISAAERAPAAAAPDSTEGLAAIATPLPT